MKKILGLESVLVVYIIYIIDFFGFLKNKKRVGDVPTRLIFI